MNRTISVHTTVANVDRLDEQAEKFRRSRNSLINEAIEMLLEHNDSENLKAIDRRIATKKKAGTR